MNYFSETANLIIFQFLNKSNFLGDNVLKLINVIRQSLASFPIILEKVGRYRSVVENVKFVITLKRIEISMKPLTYKNNFMKIWKPCFGS